MNSVLHSKDLCNVIVRLDVKPDQVESFKAFMAGYLPDTIAYSGCEYTHLMQDQDDPTKFYFFERWRSRKVEGEYIAWRMSTPEVAKLVEMLASPPQTNYSDSIWLPSPE